MIVAGIQHDIVWEDPAANFHHLVPLVEHAAGEGARLVVLTETYSTGFTMKTEQTAEAPGGPSTQFLVEQATRNGVWMCGSLPEKVEGQTIPFNQLVLVAPDGAIQRYAKIHRFTYGREHESYAGGDKFLQVTIDGVRFTFFVCYDLRFADEFWGLAEQTDCYVVVANWPAARREHWTTLLQARAIENLAYVVGVNRVGAHGRLDYSGDSMIIGPFGEVLAHAGDEETIVMADIDPARVKEVRAEWPMLSDRR
jgi:predicted amidohydrolase